MTDAVAHEGPSLQELHDATLEVLRGLFTFTRACALHGSGAEQALEAAQALRRAFARARPPFTLQVFPDAVLRDRVPLWLDLEALRKLQQLCAALARWNAQEITIDAVPDLAALIAFAHAVNSATHKDRSAKKPSVRGIEVGPVWRPGAAATAASEACLDIYAHVQAGRAATDAARLLEEPARWSHAQAQVLCFRLERATAVSASATARAIELQPPPWSDARRAVAVAFYVGAVLSRLGVSPGSQRAAMHAALACACHGLPQGLDCARAAAAAMPALLSVHDDLGSGGPHRIRTQAIAHAVSELGRGGPPMPLAALIHAAYESERARRPAGAALQLGRADVHAWLASALGTHVHAGWGRALLCVLGSVPAGSHVLCDGRLGVVAGPGRDGDPLRPRVLVGGKLGQSPDPVVLASPLCPAG
jgi:hypothetical protein